MWIREQTRRKEPGKTARCGGGAGNRTRIHRLILLGFSGGLEAAQRLQQRRMASGSTARRRWPDSTEVGSQSAAEEPRPCQAGSSHRSSSGRPDEPRDLPERSAGRTGASDPPASSESSLPDPEPLLSDPGFWMVSQGPVQEGFQEPVRNQVIRAKHVIDSPADCDSKCSTRRDTDCPHSKRGFSDWCGQDPPNWGMQR